MSRLFAVVLSWIVLTAVSRHAVAQPFISGIDVSRWQGNVNWNSAKSAGIEFAFAKATEGVNYVDGQFHNNMQGATAAGVMIGPYHFCRIDSYDGVPFTTYDGSPFLPGSTPYLDAMSEANDFLEAIVPYYEVGSYLPPVADVEGLPDFGSSSLERTFISNWMQVFSDTINSTLGTRPIIYTSKYGANTRFTSQIATQHELWLAWWKGTGTSNPPVASDTPLFGDWQFWQYTAEGSVAGVSGNVDRDVFEGTLADLQALQITLGGDPGTGFENVAALADFESGDTPFQWSTSYSGSNSGILTGSDAVRITTDSHDGDASQQLTIVGDPAGWFLRHVSGTTRPVASPATNVPFGTTGSVGMWLKTEDAGVTVHLAVDDPSPSIDRGVGQEITADGNWHLYEWDLEDNGQWEGWTSGANGVIDGPTVTLDSIQFSGTGNAVIFMDGVAHNPDGSLLASQGDFDYDGDVDADDLAAWQVSFGSTTGAAVDDGDADGDGDVDGQDYLSWQRNYEPALGTESAAQTAVVPEPASLTGGALLAILALFRNRRGGESHHRR